jgi:hypothetical protein
MNDIVEKAAANAWFTLIGRGAVVATLAIASWMGLAVISLQSDVKVLSNTVALGMTDRYRADDARRDFQLHDLRVETLAMRLSDLEHEVRANKIDIKQQEQKIEQGAPRRPSR